MKKIPTRIAVVAALIEDLDGRILMQKRGPAGRHAGLWEFPGGKVEMGESAGIALFREIEEELALQIEIAGLSLAGTAKEDAKGAFPAIVMNLYRVARWSGPIEAQQGQEWGWFALEEAAKLPMPPMDVSLVDSLRAH